MRTLQGLVLTGVGLVLVLPGGSAGQQPGDSGATAKNLIDGTVRGWTLQAAVNGQIDKALATWKRVFLGKGPASHETAHLVLFGAVPNKAPKDVGAALERHYALAAKALAMEHQEPWPGKLSVFCLNERGLYTSFIRVVQQRRIEEGEAGSFHIEEDWPYVVAGPPLSKLDPPIDGQAGEQLAAALLSKKGGAKLPLWMLSGFGRATHLRGGTFAALTAEHRRAYVLVAKNKRTLKDVTGGGLADDEATILRASVMEYLAYSNRIARFVPLVEGFRPSDTVAEPTFDTALKSANLALDRLDQSWQAWVKSFK